MSSGPVRRRRHSTSIGPYTVVSPGKALRIPVLVAPKRWELWTQRRAVIAYVLAVEMTAIAMSVALLSQERIDRGSLLMLLAIVAMGLGKEEITRRVEQKRRRFSDTPHLNMTSVWTFAAALLLPAGLAIVVVVPIYGYLWLRVWGPAAGTRVWKLVFSASAVVLSCHSATGVMHIFETPPTDDVAALIMVTVAILVYSVVNLGLVAGAITLMTTDRTIRRLLGTLIDAALEFVTLAMGALAAEQLYQGSWFVLLLVPALIALHENVRIRQLEEAASADPKTGLFNAVTWRTQAMAELERAKREQEPLGVLLLDIDHFKHINDGNGHLVGDDVIAAIAQQLEQVTRPYDLLGRFGGDEFVMLCPAVDGATLVAIAERARTAIEQLAITHHGREVRVTMSIGAAHFPDAGDDIEDLLLAADNALFAAKDGQRNRVVLARFRSPTASSQASSDASSN